jgi:DNA repair exonuclease SbcCD nuclease subunit
MIYLGADFHLERFNWKSKRELDGDSFTALNNVAEVILADAKTHTEESLLILAGDTFDTKKVDGLTLEAFRKFCDKLKEAEITIAYIQGNHDKNVKPIPDVFGCENLHGTRFLWDSRVIRGVESMPREQMRGMIMGIEPCDLLVLHCAFEHIIGYADAADISVDEIPVHVKHVFAGDVHIRDITPLPSGGSFLSPGPIHPCNLAQGGRHGIYKLPQISDTFEFMPIESRYIRRFDLHEETDLEDLKEYLRDHTMDLKPLMDLRYPTSLSAAVETIMAQNVERAVFFTNPNTTGKLKELAMYTEGGGYEKASLESSLEIAVDPEKDKELFTFLSNLLTTDDAVGLVENMVKEVV